MYVQNQTIFARTPLLLLEPFNLLTFLRSIDNFGLMALDVTCRLAHMTFIVNRVQTGSSELPTTKLL